jgi:hypothetical protein
MPCEIKELVINTTINQDSLPSRSSNEELSGEKLKESYLLSLIHKEINKAKVKIISDCIDQFNENNRLINQR